jgi:hypothetical protein
MARTIRLPTTDGEYLRLSANRLGIPDDRIPHLIRIDAFPANEAPTVLTSSLLIDGFDFSLRQPLDAFSDPEGKWHGYQYKAIGTLAADHPLAGPHRDLDLGLSSLDLPGQSFQIWQARVFSPETSLYAQVTWRPGDKEPEPSVGNWPKRRPPATEIALVHQAMGLIWEIDARRGMTDAKALEDATDWAQAWLDRNPGASPLNIGHPELHKTSGMTPKSTDNFLNRHHITLPKIRRKLAERDGI